MEGWHLKREIQLGHLLTTISVAVSVIIYVQKLDTRIAMLEQARLEQKDRDERQDKSSSEAIGLLRQQLERIEGKLDRLVERRQ